MTILVVEDEQRMAELLRRGLAEEGHAVTAAATGDEGFEVARSYTFDLIVLDVMLPGMDGFEVARRLRAQHNRTPILMLTARDAVQDIVAGLDLGADDYLAKPFAFEVFLARVRALGRRGPIPHPASLEFADLAMDPATREVRRGERRIALTRTEFAILELLMRRSGQVVPRETIIDTVWGIGADVESNTLDAFVRLLRAKVEIPGQPKRIHTIRGVGYALRELS
jgi:DNA-binding response OmpR family regulator